MSEVLWGQWHDMRRRFQSNPNHSTQMPKNFSAFYYMNGGIQFMAKIWFLNASLALNPANQNVDRSNWMHVCSNFRNQSWRYSDGDIYFERMSCSTFRNLRAMFIETFVFRWMFVYSATEKWPKNISVFLVSKIRPIIISLVDSNTWQKCVTYIHSAGWEPGDCLVGYFPSTFGSFIVHAAAWKILRCVRVFA